MKRTVKKIVAVGLTLTSVMGLAACGTSAKDDSKATSAEVTKPDKFTVMVDGTVVTEANGGLEFRKQLQDALDLNIEWVQPDHSGYTDAVANAFNSDDTTPDICILSSDYYASYAANGFLWNMTDAWNNSATKSSGRLIDTADNVLKALQVNGSDGKQAMYGFSPYRGNGCVTYMKESWLKQAGYTAADVQDKTLTFAQYYEILKKMNAATGKSVVMAPEYISKEAPFTNYLPEFYQQANFTFYKDSTGKYVDGFSEKAMKDALTRIAQGVKDGVIDKETVTGTTSLCRDKFYADNTGVFTYWAGSWAETLRSNLAGKKLDTSLIAIKPIKELGTYVERIAPCWAITTHAKNPEGIFKFFLDKMLDGGTVQTLWTYGAKGVHWNDIAESVTLSGSDKSTAYTAGQFHFLPSVEKPTTLQTKNHIDPLLSLAKFTSGDPGAAAIVDLAKTNMDFFAKNSSVAVPVPQTTVLGDNIGDINTQRQAIVAKVATGELTADQGIAEYTKNVGSLVQKSLDSLNKVK